MKQILLRVPDALRDRLSAQASRSGKSVNALATGILDAAADASTMDRRTRFLARAAALGMLADTPSMPRMTVAERNRIVATTQGVGPVLDDLVVEDRDRL